MANYGKYEVPDEFQDEDKWFLLTKRQWLIIAPPAALTVFASMLVLGFGLTFLFPIVLIFGVLLVLAAFVVAFKNVPDTWYLYGGGMRIERVLFRMLRKKFGKHVVYTKHFDDEGGE